jgi:Flp pilus assembly protein TadD
MLARAVALAPEKAETHRFFAVACSTLGWTEAAETELRRSLKLRPDDAEAAFNLAVLLSTQGHERAAEARDWYDKALKLGAERDPGLDRVLGRPE